MTLPTPRSVPAERPLSRYVRPHFGAYSPDLTRSIRLPRVLYDLWVALTDRPNEIQTYLTLTRALWPLSVAPAPDLVRAHAGRLRSLLVRLGWAPTCIEVVWGQGVMFHPPERRVI